MKELEVGRASVSGSAASRVPGSDVTAVSNVPASDVTPSDVPASDVTPSHVTADAVVHGVTHAIGVSPAPQGQLRCPYCHTTVVLQSERSATCERCGAVHHAACWGESFACASCRGLATVEPLRPRWLTRPAGDALAGLAKAVATLVVVAAAFAGGVALCLLLLRFVAENRWPTGGFAHGSYVGGSKTAPATLSTKRSPTAARNKTSELPGLARDRAPATLDEANAALERDPTNVAALSVRLSALVAEQRWSYAIEDARRIARITGLPADEYRREAVEQLALETQGGIETSLSARLLLGDPERTRPSRRK